MWTLPLSRVPGLTEINIYTFFLLHSSKRKSQLLDDIDALLGDELATIQSMEVAFKNKEERDREREEREKEELQQMELKAKEVRTGRDTTIVHSGSVDILFFNNNLRLLHPIAVVNAPLRSPQCHSYCFCPTVI